MKKYILLGVITLAGIFNFSSADNILYQGNYTCKSSECEDNLISFTPSLDNISIGTNLCFEYGFYSDASDPSSISYTYSYNFPDYENWNEMGGNGNYSNVICSSNREDNKNYGIDFWGLSPSGDYNFTNYFKVYEYATGGEGGSGGEGGNIIAGGISAFSGIIDRLGGIFGEFGPYIIYIAIACLGISLLFKALKYILGFTNNSAKNSIGGSRESRKKRKFNKFIGMSNRRNRRRFNRRHRNRPKRYNKIRYELNERR